MAVKGMDWDKQQRMIRQIGKCLSEVDDILAYDEDEIFVGDVEHIKGALKQLRNRVERTDVSE